MRFYDSSWGEIHPKSSKLIPNTDSWNTHLNWYTLVIYWDAPSQIEGFPWQASSRAETPTLRQRDALKEDLPHPKCWPVRKRCFCCDFRKRCTTKDGPPRECEKKKNSQESEIPRDK